MMNDSASSVHRIELWLFDEMLSFVTLLSIFPLKFQQKPCHDDPHEWHWCHVMKEAVSN